MSDFDNFQTGSQWRDTSGEFAAANRKQVRDSSGRFGKGWGITVQGLEVANANLLQWEQNFKETIKEGAENLKDEMVAYMKEHATWEDQTGRARAGLHGFVVWQDDMHFTILLGHGEDIYYGIWLEVRFGGRHAILLPTIRKFAPSAGSKIIGMA